MFSVWCYRLSANGFVETVMCELQYNIAIIDNEWLQGILVLQNDRLCGN